MTCLLLAACEEFNGSRDEALFDNLADLRAPAGTELAVLSSVSASASASAHEDALTHASDPDAGVDVDADADGADASEAFSLDIDSPSSNGSGGGAASPNAAGADSARRRVNVSHVRVGSWSDGDGARSDCAADCADRRDTCCFLIAKTCSLFKVLANSGNDLLMLWFWQPSHRRVSLLLSLIYFSLSFGYYGEQVLLLLRLMLIILIARSHAMDSRVFLDVRWRC